MYQKPYQNIFIPYGASCLPQSGFTTLSTLEYSDHLTGCQIKTPAQSHSYNYKQPLFHW